MTTIPAQTLAAALKGAAAIVETRNTIPLLACVRLTANGDGLTLTTTNLDLEYRVTLDATGDFDVCVHAKRLLAMASAASGDIALTPGANNLTVKAGRSRWVAPTLPAGDFPAMPFETLSPPIAINLAHASRRLLWAASNAPTQAHLSGVYLNAEKAKAVLVAADGYALASIATDIKWPKGAPDVILPRPFCAALPDGVGALSWDDRKVRFTTETATITASLVEGPFVDYRKVYKPPVEPIAVDVEGLAGAVRRVRIASDAQQRKLRVVRRDGALGLRIEGTSGFEGDEEVEADCAEGFETCVNADYLVSMLGAVEAETVAIEQEEGSPTISFRPVAGGGGFSAIVMAMKF